MPFCFHLFYRSNLPHAIFTQEFSADAGCDRSGSLNCVIFAFMQLPRLLGVTHAAVLVAFMKLCVSCSHLSKSQFLKLLENPVPQVSSAEGRILEAENSSAE